MPASELLWIYPATQEPPVQPPAAPALDSDAWNFQSNQPVFVDRRQHLYQSFFYEKQQLQAEEELLIASASITTVQVIELKVLYQSVQSPPLFTISAPEEVTLDKWFMPASEPVRTRPTQQFEYRFQDPAPVIPPFTYDWYVPTNQPVQVPPRLHPNGLVVGSPLPVDAPFTFDWYVQTNEPVRLRPTLRPNGWLVSDPAPVIPPFTYDWYVPTNEPVRVPARLHPNGIIVGSSFPIVPPFIFDWYQQTNEPVRVRPHLIGNGGYFSWWDIPAVPPEEPPDFYHESGATIGQPLTGAASIPAPLTAIAITDQPPEGHARRIPR
jgi:hypothetical protein